MKEKMQTIPGLVILGSPLVHGMDPVEPPQPPPAQRLVLAVVDGLRADKAFENRMERMPFLRDKVLNKGRWGISHTRVPTESRPGHVAIIAGFYEDVSAVTKGWKTNPVEFDSLFNQSRHTWSFGSPDILPMFAYGASDESKVEMFMYEAEAEDFAKDDASKLDTWVFERFERLFKRSEQNETLNALLHSDKIVFFLHLLGVDTNGHAHRPHSHEYSENIRLADKGLWKVELLIDSFYKRDGRTAYIVTADHGMGNRGAHGDGHPDNTQTPLIAWGAGIPGPDHDHPTGHDDLSQPWELNDVQRNDVRQADIAPLMSTLIGVPYPKNSVGTLPLVYLEGSNKFKAEAAFGNAKQILAQVEIKAKLKRQTELIFRPFVPLIGHKRKLDSIHGKILSGKYEEAEAESFILIEICLLALRYYQTYDWLFLRSVVSLGYIGWIVYSTIFLLKNYVKPDAPTQSSPQRSAQSLASNSFLVNVSGVIMAVATFSMLYMKDSPFPYYFYVSFPIFFWGESLKQRTFIQSLLRTYTKASKTSKVTTASVIVNVVLPTVSYIGALELLVYSYFQRSILTVCLLAAGWGWPLAFPIEFRKQNGFLIWLWRLSCTGTSIFTTLSVELEENLTLILLGGVAILLLGLLGYVMIPHYVQQDLPSFTEPQGPRTRSRTRSGASAIQSNSSDSTWAFILIQICLNFVSMLIVTDTSRSLKQKQGLPLMNSVCSWFILAFSAIMPVLDQVRPSQHYLKRLLVIFLSFAPVFILLSVSYEALFYASLSATLLLWMLVEKQLYVYTRSLDKGRGVYQEVTDKGIKRSFELSDLRRATFFLMLINMAFFGTGNIASISSFSLESVYRFTTVFNPFLMAALLLFKILIPFFVTSAIFGLLSRLIDLPLFSLYLLVMSTTDIMTLNFFFLVRDDGSWLEIGTTISHFIIASAFIVFQILLFSISHWLVGNVLIPSGMNRLLELKKQH